MSAGAVFVTGATGFLGGVLVRRLLADGREVVASGRNADRLQDLRGLGASVLPLDLGADLSEMTEMDWPSCGAVVHCAALSSPWGKRADFVRANIVGTQNAIEIARRLGAKRFVHISTPSVYFQFADQENVSEEMALPKPVNVYAGTKRAAEKLVLEAGELDPVVLRPRGLYGAGDEALLPRLLAAAAARPLPLMRGGVAGIDLTHVEDVASAALAALRADEGVAERVFNISGGALLPVVEIVEAACARAGVRAAWRKVPVGVVLAYARTLETVCRLRPSYPEPALTAYAAGLFAFRQSLDISRAQKHLGWTPKIGFEEGLERTFAGLARGGTV